MERRPFAVTRVPGPLHVLALTDEGLGNTSWAVRLDDHVVIVDAERDPEPYLDAVEELGGRLTIAADTHLHADYLTGTPELAAHGAQAIAAADGRYEWDHRPLSGGDTVDLGRWQLRTLPTPGHTPEHVAYLVAEAGAPKAVFTGGSLLVGAVARTDLTDPSSTEELTRQLWRGINRELLSLPDDVAVFPTHGAGSFCSAAGGGQRWTTVGAERRANPLLQAADEDEFVRAVLSGLGSFPPYFLRLRELNRLGPRIVGALPLLERLSAEQLNEIRDRRGLVIDVRPVADYAAGHIEGSLANTLRPQFASWLGWMVTDPTQPLVFVVDDHTDRRELVRQCLNIGYENLAGVITIADWRAGGGDTTATPLLSAGELAGRHVVDVRQDAEYAAAHVPDATHVELGALATDALQGDGPLVVMCGHGERAATAASVLEAKGRHDVAILDGGPDDWAAANAAELVR